MLELVSCFRFQILETGDDVFLYGDRGETFYIIIKGLVGVRIPNPKIKDWKLKHEDFKRLRKWVNTLERKYSRLRGDKRRQINEQREREANDIDTLLSDREPNFVLDTATAS